MADPKIGVLVMSYGTPESMDGIAEYYTHIRRGHAPTPEQLAELTARYEAVVGGVFPLRENTNRQADGLQAALDAAAPGRYAVYQGLKHARPYIEDGVAAMAENGVKQAVGIVLAPHFSTMSVGSYMQRAREEAEAKGIAFEAVESYHLHPKLIEALVKRVKDAYAELEAKTGGEGPLKVLFSAHSLPARIREIGDPYEEQLLATSASVAEGAGTPDWAFTWQSAGRTREPWLGPDILETLKETAEAGYKGVLSAPIGFVSEHLEVLYDLDIEARAEAKALGIRLVRIDMLGTDPLYMETLADCVEQASRGAFI
ncbi:ferrochelatase [Paenibacillus sp. MWE-103]|uniref:Coproporphyrin III ferrochelatase n=1 Tax=Paenibacillus artemisiicola TaxID=1172618 RepID=A0ABS3WAV1_9BACL|nr:ferrochelatase [Paenibacillus artemisiicola]MBO7745444.1 ferrochelatase [Paenibacillus artemisiicola]